MIETDKPLSDLAVFAGRVRRARQAKRLSQVAMAEKIGCSNKQLNNIEHAQNWPSMPVYLAICRVLELEAPPLLK